MILLVGDSNLRQVLEDKKEALEEELEEEVVFEQATTNETIQVVLNREREQYPKIVFISSILNEIAAKIGKGTKTREEAIKNVSQEQNICISSAAEKHQDTLFLQCPPFLRQDPKWIEEKLKMIRFYISDDHQKFAPQNYVVLSDLEIQQEDLAPDKVHLAHPQQLHDGNKER